MAEFVLPKGLRKNISGVYMMRFDDTHFYVGSSINIRARIWRWWDRLKRGEFKNVEIEDVYPSVRVVSFEILLECAPEMTKIEEDAIIKAHIGKAGFLNRAHSAFGNHGMKQRADVVQRQIDRTPGKRVAKIDEKWQLVEIYKTVGEAARKNNVTEEGIRRSARYSGEATKGLIFRFVADDGSLIETIAKIKKPRKKYPPRTPEQRERIRTASQKVWSDNPDRIQPGSKAIDVFDRKTGEKLHTFRSIHETAKQLNLDKPRISKCLKGQRGNRKYVFRLAESK